MDHIPQNWLEQKRDEISSLLAAKEAECADLRIKRNALEVAIGILGDSNSQHPTSMDCEE